MGVPAHQPSHHKLSSTEVMARKILPNQVWSQTSTGSLAIRLMFFQLPEETTSNTIITEPVQKPSHQPMLNNLLPLKTSPTTKLDQMSGSKSTRSSTQLPTGESKKLQRALIFHLQLLPVHHRNQKHQTQLQRRLRRTWIRPRPSQRRPRKIEKPKPRLLQSRSQTQNPRREILNQ